MPNPSRKSRSETNNHELTMNLTDLLPHRYPALEPLTLQPGKPLVLKYRVILFMGKTAQPAS